MMRGLRYAARNVSLLNLLLAAVIAMILVYALFPLFSSRVAYRPHSGRAIPAPASGLAAQEPVMPSPADYTVVVENNLFHPERRIPPEKKEEQQVPKPELILYGTLISPDLTVAYIDDKKTPFTSPGRGKRQRIVRKGDTIGGFILKEIEPTGITLVRDGEVITFSLETEKTREEPGGAQAPAIKKEAIQKAPASQAISAPVIPSRKTPPPPGVTTGVTSRQLPALKTQIK